MVNRIKTALERDARLLSANDEAALRRELRLKLESLCQVLHVSARDKGVLLEYIESLPKQVKGG
jgi:hypothetical protein